MAARSALLAALVLFWQAGVACAQARDLLEERKGFLECGNVRISARAVCHADTSLCVSQTLTFSGASGRATLAPHFHKSAYRHNDRMVDVLDYHAVSWACAAGSRSGRYLVVGLQRAGSAACTECDYEQVYNLNGRLLVSGMSIDADGRVRENREGRSFIGELKSSMHPKETVQTGLWPLSTAAWCCKAHYSPRGMGIHGHLTHQRRQHQLRGPRRTRSLGRADPGRQARP